MNDSDGYDPTGYDPTGYDPACYDPACYDPTGYEFSNSDGYEPTGKRKRKKPGAFFYAMPAMLIGVLVLLAWFFDLVELILKK